MSIESFGYAMLLHGGEQREALLALLPKDRREAVESVLKDENLGSVEQIRDGLRQHRESQRKLQHEAAEERLHISLDRVNRKLSAWLVRPF